MEIALIQQFTVIFSVASLLMFLTYLPNNKHIPGVKLWTVALIFFPIAHWLFTQHYGHFWSVFIANVLLSSALTLIMVGTRAFYGLTKYKVSLIVYLISAIIATSYYFTLIVPDITMRRILLSFIAVSCLIIMISSIINVKQYQGKAKTFLLTLCIVTSLSLFTRIFLKLHFSDQELQSELQLLHQIVELMMLAMGFLFAISFSFLCQSRYTHYRRASEQQHINELELKAMFMQTLEAEISKPLQALIRANEDKEQPDHSIIAEQAKHLSLLSQEVFSQESTDSLASKKQPQVVYTRLEEWLTNILQSLQALANEKQINLSLNFPDPIGPCYLLEQYKLGLVINNLFTQILNIMPNGTILLTVHIKQSTSSQDATLIHFDFSEPTSGSSNNLINKDVFTNHYGSQLSQRVIASLGSQLEFNKDNQGQNHMFFEIIASEGVDDDIRYQIPRYNIAPVNHLDILLVSHDRRTQQTVTDILNQHKHYLDIAQNTEEMLARLNDSAYSVIILDINANDFNALDVPHLIKKRGLPNQEIPIVALTNNVSSVAKLALSTEGLTTLVAKPIQEGSLQRAINSIIKSHSPLETDLEYIEDAPTRTSKESSLAIGQAPIVTESSCEEVIFETIGLEQSHIADTEQSSQLPRFIQQRKNGDTPMNVNKETKAPTTKLFNPNALPLLELNSQETSLLDIIKNVNKEINTLFAQLKQQLSSRNKEQLPQTMYMLARASDKLGYVSLAELLLTTETNTIEGTGGKEFLQFEKVLLESQQLLAEHIKTLP